MNNIRISVGFYVLMAIAATGILLPSCIGKSLSGYVVFTRVAGNNNFVKTDSSESIGSIPASQIVALDPDKADRSTKILTTDFYSARSPEISYDGKNMLFCARKTQDDPWQIWEMNLAGSKVRQITLTHENCIDPAYLPGGRLVFSKEVANDSLKAGYSLFTGNLDGSDFRRITFSPETYFSPGILKDGRILSISKQVYPVQKDPLLIVMRPDGTKASLFYKGAEGCTFTGRSRESADGKIFFIEARSDKEGKGRIISVSYNRPLHTHLDLTSGMPGDFNSVSLLKSGQLLVSYKKSGNENLALYVFDPVKKILGKEIYGDDGYNVTEAVEVIEYERPRMLPSEVNMVTKTGLILCQDIKIQDEQKTNQSSPFTHTASVEIMGVDSSLGVFRTAEDGSFYLRIIADKPFQIRTLDMDGKVIQKCDWLWLRPNERRGCVGCHEDQELSPENRIPLAVKKAPVGIPVHINKIKEKEIDTE